MSSGRGLRWRLAARVMIWASLGGAIAAGVYLARGLLADRPLVRGEHAYRRGAWRDAAAEAQSALRSEPERPEAQVLLARSLARLGRDETARGLYRRLDPLRLGAEDYFLVGRGLVAAGKIEDGVIGLRSALEHEPDHAESLRELIRIDRRVDRLAEASELSRRLASLPGHEAVGLVLLGLTRQAQHDPRAAADAFRMALARDPTLGGVAEGTPEQIRTLLARALLLAGEPAEARAELEALLESGPDDPERNWLLSRAALQLRDLSTATVALSRSHGFNSDRPEAPEPAPHVGLGRCAECHARIFRDQRASHHAQTFHLQGDLAELKLPDRPLTDPARPDVTHSLAYHGKDLVYATQLPDAKLQAIVAFVLGSGDRAMTLVGRDEAGGWHELRMTRYGPIDGWDVTPGHQHEPGSGREYLGKVQDADMLRRCLGCHTTRARLGPSGADILAADERGFACERCHGPAGNHLAAMDLKLKDPAIGRPRLASATAVNALCGQCHSAEGRGVGIDDPNLARFQVTALALSRCTASEHEPLSCVACHSPHRNAEKSPAYYEEKCLECHSRRGPAPTVAAVCPVDASRGCVECHMPRVQTDAPHTTFTDHRIRVIRPGASSGPGDLGTLSQPGHSSPGPGDAP